MKLSNKGCLSNQKRTIALVLVICFMCLTYLMYSTHFLTGSYEEAIQTSHDVKILRWSKSLQTDEHENDRIYFHETTGRNSLGLRQLCAVESTAKENPGRPVQLFMQTDDIDEQGPVIPVLSHYPNVVVFLLNATEYFAGTPLEKWYHSTVWRDGPYRTEHFSDYIRILSIYKAGGMYLDLDFVTLKQFDRDVFWNFVTEEDNEALTGSAIHLEKGHPILKLMLEYLSTSYLPHAWTHSGPAMIQHTVLQFCQKEKPKPLFPEEICQNLKVLPKQFLYPFSYPAWKQFFVENPSSLFTNSSAMHMWNKLSKNEPIVVGSKQTYSVVAKEHCPHTYAHADISF